MTKRFLFLLLASFTIAPRIRAQGAEDEILRVAARDVARSTVARVIGLDTVAAPFVRARGVAEAGVRLPHAAMSRELRHAKPGRLGDFLSCAPAGTTGRCSLHGVDAVVSFSGPSVRADTAFVRVTSIARLASVRPGYFRIVQVLRIVQRAGVWSVEERRLTTRS